MAIRDRFSESSQPSAHEPQPPFLMQLFGGPVLLDSLDRPVQTLGRKGLTLLALVMSQRQKSILRATAAATLWPDATEFDAKNRLNVTLTRIRQSLGDASPLGVSRTNLEINPEAVSTDVQLFRNDVSSAQRALTIPIKESVLLRGLGRVNAAYLPLIEQPWVLYERDRLERDIRAAISDLLEVFPLTTNPSRVVETIQCVTQFLPDGPEISMAFDKLGSAKRVVDARSLDRENNGIESLLTAGPSSSTTNWDLGKDAASLCNPNGCWEYGWCWDVLGEFMPFRALGNLVSLVGQIPRLRSDAWAELCICFNPSSSNFYYNEVTVPPGTLLMHPGPVGQKASIRWTCPARGKYRYRFQVMPLSPDATTDVYLVVAKRIVWCERQAPEVQLPSFTGEVEMEAGDQIIVAVGDGGDGHWRDSTGIDLQISAAKTL